MSLSLHFLLSSPSWMSHVEAPSRCTCFKGRNRSHSLSLALNPILSLADKRLIYSAPSIRPLNFAKGECNLQKKGLKNMMSTDLIELHLHADIHSSTRLWPGTFRSASPAPAPGGHIHLSAFSLGGQIMLLLTLSLSSRCPTLLDIHAHNLITVLLVRHYYSCKARTYCIKGKLLIWKLWAYPRTA